ncbi:unnamed protein product, partial [Ascophyllum nodosum]
LWLPPPSHSLRLWAPQRFQPLPRFHSSCPSQASGTPCRHTCGTAPHATAGSPRAPRRSELHTLVGRGTSPTPTATTAHNAECSLPRATGLKVHVPQQGLSVRTSGLHQRPGNGGPRNSMGVHREFLPPKQRAGPRDARSHPPKRTSRERDPPPP